MFEMYINSMRFKLVFHFCNTWICFCWQYVWTSHTTIYM